MGSAMKKMCGFVLFWIAAGMTIMMFVNSCVRHLPDYILSYFGL